MSLIQTHLSKLDELDIIEYDDWTKTIPLSSAADLALLCLSRQGETGAEGEEPEWFASSLRADPIPTIGPFGDGFKPE